MPNPPEPDGVLRSTFQNGLRLVLVPMPHAQTACVCWSVRVGRRDEPEARAGVTFLLNHMMSRTTEGRPDVKTQLGHLSRLGALWTADTSHEQTDFQIEVRPHRVLEAIDAIGEMARWRSFGAFEVERDVVLDRLEQEPPNLVEVTERRVWPEEAAIGLPVHGGKNSLAALSVDDLRAHQSLHYTALNSVVVVAGPFDEAEVRARVARCFAALPTGTVPPRRARPPPRPGGLHSLPDAASVAFLAFPLPGPDALLQVQTEVVRSRLEARVRARGGVNSATCDQEDSTEMTMAWIYLEAEQGKLAAVLAEVGDELAELGRTGPTSVELEQAHEFVLGAWGELGNSPGSICRFNAESALFSSPSRFTLREQLERCTAAQLRAMAKRCFDPALMHLLLFGEAEADGHARTYQRLIAALRGRPLVLLPRGPGP